MSNATRSETVKALGEKVYNDLVDFYSSHPEEIEALEKRVERRKELAK